MGINWSLHAVCKDDHTWNRVALRPNAVGFFGCSLQNASVGWSGVGRMCVNLNVP